MRTFTERLGLGAQPDTPGPLGRRSRPAERLYADALSPPGGPADSYLKMFDNNLPQLKAAMLGM